MFGEIGAVSLLVAVLVSAVVRPKGPPEALVAIPAAALLLAVGVVDLDAARAELDRLLPILAFLAAVLVLAHACAVEGLFDAAGRLLARRSGGSGSRLLLLVFGMSAVVTSVLSLDATVVLLTPVVLTTAARMRVRGSAHVYATGHLANSASLLLPMANLTNLLALAASGLTLVAFARLMALPFLAVLIVEYVVLRLYFRRELADESPSRAGDDEPGTDESGDDESGDDEPAAPTPRVAIAVLAATLVGFVATSFVDIEPYVVAGAGAAVLVAHALRRGLARVTDVAAAADAPFLLFVLGLAIVVRGVVDGGLGPVMSDLVPAGEGLGALLIAAALAAVLANLVNNLPALLILVGPAEQAGPLVVLAVLIGVNVGPNLTYTGSLATLLWKRVLADHGLTPSLPRFTALGVLTVPAGVALGVVALWAGALLLAPG